MDDDDVFARGMKSLGVEPLGGRGAGPAKARQDRPAEARQDRPAKGGQNRLDEDDRRLFEQAMRDLGAGGDKAGGSSSRPPSPKPRRLKTRPKHLRIDEQLDLHGLKGDEAEKRLGHFVARAAASGVRTVLVITGKGHHSPGGRGVLRQRVEAWIGGRGRSRIRAWSQAPARLGGRGAFVLYLRKPD